MPSQFPDQTPERPPTKNKPAPPGRGETGLCFSAWQLERKRGGGPRQGKYAENVQSVALTSIHNNLPGQTTAADRPRKKLLTGSPNALSADAPEKRKLTMRTVDEILGMTFSDDDRLLDNGYLTKGESFVMLGAGGIGKSRLLMQMAVCSIIGKPWVGMPTRGHGHRWLVLQAENSCRRLQADLEHVRAWLTDDEWDQLRQCLCVHTLEADVDTFLALSRAENYDRIQEAISDFEPDVVVWDPLKDFAIGNLNNDMDMQETVTAISQVTRLGNPKRIPLVVHHAGTGRAGAVKAVGYDRSSFGRNSKLMNSWTRAQINVAAYEPDSCAALVIASGKCNNYAEFQPFGVRLDPETMIYEVDPTINVEAWQERVNGGEKAKPTHADVPALLVSKRLSQQELANTIRQEYKVSQATAYRWITQATDEGSIGLDSTQKCYVCLN